MFDKYDLYKTIFIILFSLNIIKCDSSEKSEKQLRYDACYKLIQIKMEHEKSLFKELSQEFNQEEINNILQYTLFECYQNINYYDAEEIDSKNNKDIDIYQDNYAELLNFEKWEDLLRKKDENSIQYALMDLQKAYRDIQSGEIKINRYQKKPSQRQRKPNTDDYNQKDNDEQFNFPNDMERDFELFGINFSNISPTIKNIIGITLIIFVFVCVIIGLKWIQNIRGSNDKNKKKKNKKDKKEKKK